MAEEGQQGAEARCQEVAVDPRTKKIGAESGFHAPGPYFSVCRFSDAVRQKSLDLPHRS